MSFWKYLLDGDFRHKCREKTTLTKPKRMQEHKKHRFFQGVLEQKAQTNMGFFSDL